MQQSSLPQPELNAHLASTSCTGQAQHQDATVLHGSQQQSPDASIAEDSSNAHQAFTAQLQRAQTAGVQMHSDAAIGADITVQGASAGLH